MSSINSKPRKSPTESASQKTSNEAIPKDNAKSQETEKLKHLDTDILEKSQTTESTSPTHNPSALLEDNKLGKTTSSALQKPSVIATVSSALELTSNESPHLIKPISIGVREIPLKLKWKNPKSLKKHFEDHEDEFPEFKTHQEYLIGALGFWDKPILTTGETDKTDIVEKRGTKGPLLKRDKINFAKLYRFERSTGTISTIQPDPKSPEKLLITMFKPGYSEHKSLEVQLQYAEKYFNRQ